MKEFFKRLRARPMLATELCVVSFLVNIFAFADIIYVMLILRRYIDHGVDGTLLVLTLGALVALGLQYLSGETRLVLAGEVGADPDRARSDNAFRALVRSRAAALSALPASSSRELPANLAAGQAGYDASVVTAFMDAPFSLLFVAATAVLSPILGVVVALGMFLTLASGAKARKRLRRVQADYREENAANQGLIGSATSGADTVRVFRGKAHYRTLWQEQTGRLAALRSRLAAAAGLSKSASATSGAFVRVGIYAVGARLVVSGDLSFAALIGASMLGTYAVQKMAMLTASHEKLTLAQDAGAKVDEVLELPRESTGGRIDLDLPGDVSFKNLEFIHPGAVEPVFTGLDLDLPRGTVLAAYGFNGSGKTTLARLAAGLLQPTGGEILAGGAPLDVLGMDAWRSNLIYMPQEPYFLGGTIRDNLTMPNPDIAEGDLNGIISLAGLSDYLFTSPKGLETPMAEAGRGLSLGIRKRMALARAMVTGGKVAILDEPTDGLDAQGVQAVYAALNELMSRGCTILAFTADPVIRRAARVHLDLGTKPVPTVRHAPGQDSASLDSSSGDSGQGGEGA